MQSPCCFIPMQTATHCLETVLLMTIMLINAFIHLIILKARGLRETLPRKTSSQSERLQPQHSTKTRQTIRRQLSLYLRQSGLIPAEIISRALSILITRTNAYIILAGLFIGRCHLDSNLRALVSVRKLQPRLVLSALR